MIEGSLCPPLSQSECDDAPSLRLKRGGGSDAGVILILPRLPADLIIPDISLFWALWRQNEWILNLQLGYLQLLFALSSFKPIIQTLCAMCQIQPEALKHFCKNWGKPPKTTKITWPRNEGRKSRLTGFHHIEHTVCWPSPPPLY